MDDLEYAKIGGVICAGLLAFVGFGEVSKAVVSMDQVEEAAYVIELPEAEVAEVEEEVVPIGELMASADLDKGAKVFKKCTACHKAADGAAHGTGPNLYGVVGREIGGADGYDKYSGALPSGEVWDFAALDGFLEKPRDWAPGTSMGFAGLKKPEERAAVIAWLNQQSAAPLPVE